MVIRKIKIFFLNKIACALLGLFFANNFIQANEKFVCQNFYSFNPNQEKNYTDNVKSVNYINTLNSNQNKETKLNLGYLDSFNNFNPYSLVGTLPINYYNIYFDTLFISPLDDINVFYPLLANNICFKTEKPTNLNYNSSFIVKITLNPSAKWSNNTKITSQDVYFTLNTLKHKSFAYYRTIFKDINYIEILNDENIVIYLNNNNKDLISLILSSPIISYDFFKNIDFIQTLTHPPVSSGPYIITKYSNSQITFNKNDNYWGKSLWTRIGQFNFSTINYFYFSNQSLLNNALIKGTIDFLEINDTFAEHIFTKKLLKSNNLAILDVNNNYTRPLNALFFNTKKLDKDLRKIIYYAYNTQEINTNLYQSKLNNNNVFFNPLIETKNNDNLIQYLKKELELINIKDKETLNIVITSKVESFLLFINNLKKLGFKVNITLLPKNQLFLIKDKQLYDIIEAEYLFSKPIDAELLLYFSEIQGSDYNLNNINDKVLNSYILQYINNNNQISFNALAKYIENQYLFVPILKKNYTTYVFKDKFILSKYAIENNIIDIFSWQEK
jgi:ABC-type oligopeptide transport system substrate-binding subunit